MKIRKSYQLLGVPLLMLAVSCGSDSSGTSSDTSVVDNGITSLVSEITTSVNGAAGMYDEAKKKKSIQNLSYKLWGNKDAFGSKWTTDTGSGVYDPRVNGGSIPEISIKDYLGIMLDEDVLSEGDQPYAISPFSRTSEGLKIFCAIGVGMNFAGANVDEFGYVPADSYTFSFTSALKAAMTATCNIDTTMIPDDQQVTVTVTEGTPVTGYERKYSFSFFNQEYWVTNTSTELKLVSSEDSNSSNVSRQYIHINKTTNVTKAEYVSTTLAGQQAGVELYRIFWDENNDEAMVMGYRGRAGGMSDSVASADRFLLSGKPNAGVDISVGFMVGGSATEYKGCVNADTGAIVNDDSLCTPDSDSLGGAEINEIDTLVSNFYTAYAAQAASVDWGPSGLTESDEISFTNMTDLVTAPFAP